MSAQFNNPRGIAVGNIIVADTGNRAIREVASNGSVKTLVLYDEKGRKFEGFKEPTDVAVDAEGRIVVADSKARRLWVIENGVAKVLWQTQRKDCAPVSLAIDQEGRVIFLPKAMAGCLMKLETKQIAPGLNSFTYKSRCMENDIFSRLLAGLVRRDTTSISKKNITLLKDPDTQKETLMRRIKNLQDMLDISKKRALDALEEDAHEIEEWKNEFCLPGTTGESNDKEEVGKMC